MSSNQRRNPHYNKLDKRTPMLLGFLAALLLLIVLLPKTPVVKAVNATSDNQTTYAAAGLRITEVMSDNNSTLPDERGAFSDWVEITNTTSAPISLKNVGLADRSDKIQFLFPDMTLGAGERVVVFCDKTNQDVAGKTLHAKFKLSSLGCAVFLFDSTGFAVDSVTVPTLNADESYSLMADGTYQKTDEFSPGYENTTDGHNLYLDNYVVNATTLMLNEVMAAPRSGLRDEDDELSDWVELYNAGSETIDLSKLALSDDEQKPLKWFFPEGTVIQPGQYYVVFCSGKDKLQQNGIPHTNFSISAEGETIVLSTRTGELIDRVVVNNPGKDMSYARDPVTGNWRIYTLATPMRANDASGANAMDNYLRATNYTGVYISELIASADKVTPASGDPPCDWVELYNSSSQTVDLSMFGLSDNINWPRKWQFPQGTNIRAGEYKVVRLDKSTVAGTNGNSLHASFALTRAGGEIMTFSDATGRVLDRIYLPELQTDVSYGRSIGQDGFFYYDAPTPGQANGTGFLGYAGTPALSKTGGLYSGNIIVEITAPVGTEIRYTIDGSIPTAENGEIYTAPLSISQTVVVRARGFQSGLQPSPVVTASYIMNTYFTLPVMSVVCDPDELWNPETGLFTVGDNVDTSKGIPYKNTIYGKFGKIARPGYVEMFEVGTTGEALISQGVKFELSGAYSLDMPQKSMKFRAQASYGEKYFNAALFEDRPFTYYKSFVLRNSGNDCVWTRLVDGFQSRLMDVLGISNIHLAWKPVIVYINGQYYGHYNLRERKDRFSIAQWEGFDMERADEITILRASGSVDQGSNKEWNDMIKTIKTLSPGKNAEDLQYILDRVDVDNYFDYLATEMFFGNSDIGNTMFYKLPGEGQKWKWLLYDFDYGMFNSKFDSPKSYTKAKGMGDKYINNTIFLKLLENAEMKQKFLERLAYIYNTLSPQVMQDKLTELYNILEPEMALHFELWAPQNDKKINSDSPLTKDGAIRYWNARIERLRGTINKRHYYLYGFIQDAFGVSGTQMLELFGARPDAPVE